MMQGWSHAKTMPYPLNRNDGIFLLIDSSSLLLITIYKVIGIFFERLLLYFLNQWKSPTKSSDYLSIFMCMVASLDFSVCINITSLCLPKISIGLLYEAEYTMPGS